jgi:intein-encoded DNA endonuclease-like protein
MTHEQAAFWLAGFMDGEGCVIHKPKGSRYITILNTDTELIDVVCESLATLGIGWRLSHRRRRHPHYKDSLVVNIYGRTNLDLFYRWVPFKSPEKRAKLRFALDSYVRDDPEMRERLALTD